MTALANKIAGATEGDAMAETDSKVAPDVAMIIGMLARENLVRRSAARLATKERLRGRANIPVH